MELGQRPSFGDPTTLLLALRVDDELEAEELGRDRLVEELDGRVVEYGYDPSYRLTSESIFDPGDSSPSQVIAYTYDQFLQTGDTEWPALFPMVKSAVRDTRKGPTDILTPAVLTPRAITGS